MRLDRRIDGAPAFRGDKAAVSSVGVEQPRVSPACRLAIKTARFVACRASPLGSKACLPRGRSTPRGTAVWGGVESRRGATSLSQVRPLAI